ncbi:hypothetical protein BD769DRAFT_1640718 [Suillus cothurnatus]|nr:hypothetical protein BD769DRAFT_1640718 [Suillus cothurnatus]
MTIVSNDPIAGSVGVIYDWGLTFGKEVELIWRQRWSLMTFLYLSVRYAGIGCAVLCSNNFDDRCGLNMYHALNWIRVVIEPLLGVIMIARLHAMYQRSRKVLIFVVVILLAITIANVVIAAIIATRTTGEEFILSGTHQCIIVSMGDYMFLSSMTWILGTVWEVLALCFAVWIAVKHFRELRQHSTSGIIGDCFTVLMKTHHSDSLESQIYLGFSQIFLFVQMFVLGPRLILSVREYHAELVANSDTATAMTSIAFEERVHVSTGSSV